MYENYKEINKEFVSEVLSSFCVMFNIEEDYKEKFIKKIMD